MKTIKIAPASDGWMVSSDATADPQVFRRGSSAEVAAQQLAEAVADAGEDATVEIFLRDGSLARRFIVPARRDLGSHGAGDARGLPEP